MQTTPRTPPSPDLRAGGVRDLPPARAQGLELLGPLRGSGYRDTPYLVRRVDGQTFQLTPLLYRVLEAIDGRRDHTEIAAAVSERVGKQADPDDVRFLVEEKLGPLGVLRRTDGSEPAVAKANPLLALRGRIVISDEAMTRRLTTPFAKLFAPPVALAMMTAFVLSTWWLLFEEGLAPGLRHAFYEPELLLLVFALTLLSAGFHEFGHAAACTYGGGSPGAMGAGLYLVWPVFYTDVTDAYRLDRRGRLGVDFGGLYFNAIFAVAVFGLWVVTGWDALLVVIPLQVLQMLHQLMPLVRLDGYHILADLTGVPNLFAHVSPTLRGLLSPASRKRSGTALKRGVGTIVTMWVLVVVPVLALTLLGMVLTLPRVAATAWDSLGRQWNVLGGRWGRGDISGMAVAVLSIAALAIPVLSVTYLITRVTRRTARRVWAGTAGRPALRTLAVVVAAGLLAFTLRAWWPQGQYQPIQADERGTVVDGVESLAELPSGGGVLTSSREDAPAEAVPSGFTTPAAGETAWGTGAPPAPQFAPNPPVAPSPTPDGPSDLLRELIPPPSEVGEGDNQAAVINNQDFSSTVALAFAIEWVADGVVDNINEAYALASCVRCLTMAVAFQAVIVLGPAQLAMPENRAVAINYQCLECFTYALAVQLVITVMEPLTDEQMIQLAAVKAQLESLATRIGTLTPAEITAELAGIESSLLTAVGPATGSTASDRDVEGGTPPTTSNPTPSSTAPPPATEPETTTTAPSTTTAPPTTEPPTTTTVAP